MFVCGGCVCVCVWIVGCMGGMGGSSDGSRRTTTQEHTSMHACTNRTYLAELVARKVLVQEYAGHEGHPQRDAEPRAGGRCTMCECGVGGGWEVQQHTETRRPSAGGALRVFVEHALRGPLPHHTAPQSPSAALLTPTPNESQPTYRRGRRPRWGALWQRPAWWHRGTRGGGRRG